MTTWAEGKNAHRALSEAAAQSYDEIYAASNFATGAYMDFELDVMRHYLSHAPDEHLALDLGCGTGRSTFVLGKHFESVWAYDFSQEMIRISNHKKLERRSGNILFEVRDVENDLVDLEDECASFVNTAFGMGSFCESLEKLLREVRRLLKPRGIALFSFYNADAIVNRLSLDWTPALAARAVPDQLALDVEFAGRKFRISARSYPAKQLRRRLDGVFGLLRFSTFPTLSALFPQPIFAHEAAQALCRSVDLSLADNDDIAGGPYVLAVVRKDGKEVSEPTKLGYERVLEALRQQNVKWQLREHAPLRTMEEVQAAIGISLEDAVKSVLLCVPEAGSGEHDHRGSHLYLIAVPGDRAVDFGKVAAILAVSRESLRMATQAEVEDLTGFSLGGIPPFGLPPNIPVILDERLAAKSHVWCGTGKATESARITTEQLKRLSTFSVADVSKPRHPR